MWRSGDGQARTCHRSHPEIREPVHETPVPLSRKGISLTSEPLGSGPGVPHAQDEPLGALGRL